MNVDYYDNMPILSLHFWFKFNFMLFSILFTMFRGPTDKFKLVQWLENTFRKLNMHKKNKKTTSHSKLSISYLSLMFKRSQTQSTRKSTKWPFSILLQFLHVIPAERSGSLYFLQIWKQKAPPSVPSQSIRNRRMYSFCSVQLEMLKSFISRYLDTCINDTLSFVWKAAFWDITTWNSDCSVTPKWQLNNGNYLKRIHTTWKTYKHQSLQEHNEWL